MKQPAKQAIQASFRTLLLAKNLDKIKVRDIVEDCGVTRNTFYYYYEDIYDLFDDYLDTRIHGIWTTLSEGCPWNEALQQLLLGILETPQMGRHIFYSKKQDALRQYLNKLLTAVLDRYVLESSHNLTVGADDRRMICDACCHSLYGMLEQWITSPDAPMMHEKLLRLLQCFEGAIRQALQYCAANPTGREESK